MTKLIFLGVGNGGTLSLYNTCFSIQNEKGNFLIDTGGSIEIMNKLTQAGIDYKSIKNIFISHSHTDHVLGLIWLLKKIGCLIMFGENLEKINIYSNQDVNDTIKIILERTLPRKLTDILYQSINFVILNDGDKHIINGIEYTFFNICAKSTIEYGFEFTEKNKKVVFLGDETVNEKIYSRLENADYVTHEAFCLDSDKDIFHPYEINKSTVKSVSKLMNEKNVKNLILYHTEETHGKNRKKLYIEEGQNNFNGKIIVPDELEEIEIK